MYCACPQKQPKQPKANKHTHGSSLYLRNPSSSFNARPKFLDLGPPAFP